MENKKEVSLEEAKQAADLVAKVELSMTDEIKLAHEMSGRRQAMASIAKLVTVADTIELQRIKESNAFKHLTNPETFESGNVSLFTTWADFCRVIVGCDRKTVDERILNLKTFGQEAIEGMNTLGLGVRQLRQLRKLPEDQLEQAKVLAKEKDVDSLKDLIEEQAVEKAKLKEALENTKKEKEAEATASSNLMAKKDKRLNDLKTELEKRAIKPDEWEPAARADILEFMKVAQSIREKVIDFNKMKTYLEDEADFGVNQKDAMRIIGAAFWDQAEQITREVANMMASVDQAFGGARNMGSYDILAFIGDDVEDEA